MSKENMIQVIASTMEQEGLLFSVTRQGMVNALRSYSVGQLEQMAEQLSEIPTAGDVRRDK